MTTSSLDVLTIGNAKLDAFLSIHEASSYCRVDHETSELCVKYGQKIPLDGCEFHVGGNAANVAVGTQRGGFSTAILAETGEDEFAAKIMNSLIKEGVDTSRILQKGESSFSLGLEFQGERTLFSEHRDRDHNFFFEQLNPKIVYLTSIGNRWEGVYEKAVEFVTSSGCIFACNPGTLQILKGKEALASVLASAHILFLNKEEAEDLFKVKKETTKELIREIRHEVPGIIVLTNGEEGAFVLDKGDKLFHIPKMAVTVVEKTGAGDAFASGFLQGFLLDKSLSECLQFGVCNSAGVIGKVGAQAGLLHKEEFAAMILNAPKVEEL